MKKWRTDGPQLANPAERHAAQDHTHHFRQLALPHDQFDEIPSRLRLRSCVLWLCLVVDPCTNEHIESTIANIIDQQGASSFSTRAMA